MNYYNGEGWLSRKGKDCSKTLGDKSQCSSKMTLKISNPFNNYVDMMMKSLPKEITYFNTINEPGIFTFFGYFSTKN